MHKERSKVINSQMKSRIVMKAKLFKVSGEIEEVEPKNNRDFKIDELQGFVEGYIEIVHLPGNQLMVVNEEGAVNGLKGNLRATLQAQSCGVLGQFACGTVFGNALICDSSQVK